MTKVKNAKKQAYPVTVTDKNGELVDPGTKVVIDQESSEAILKAFGPYQGDTVDLESKTTEVKVADLAAKPVKDAIAAAVNDATAEKNDIIESASTASIDLMAALDADPVNAGNIDAAREALSEALALT